MMLELKTMPKWIVWWRDYMGLACVFGEVVRNAYLLTFQKGKDTSSGYRRQKNNAENTCIESVHEHHNII
jgi:hypothetical protein